MEYQLFYLQVLKSVKLADKVINTTSKEENKRLVNDIEISRDKIFEQDEFNKFVIKPAHKRCDLVDTVRVILKFMKYYYYNDYYYY